MVSGNEIITADTLEGMTNHNVETQSCEGKNAEMYVYDYNVIVTVKKNEGTDKDQLHLLIIFDLLIEGIHKLSSFRSIER